LENIILPTIMLFWMLHEEIKHQPFTFIGNTIPFPCFYHNQHMQTMAELPFPSYLALLKL